MDRHFDKLLVERERSGWRVDRRGAGRRARERLRHDPDALPSRESTSMRRGGTKELDENLGPLRRFLRGALGRGWDAVRAEIKRALPGDDPVRRHIWAHVEGYVAEHVVLRQGVPFEVPPTYGSDGPWWVPFYVCPRTGRLRANPWYRRRFEPGGARRRGPGGRLYERLAGVWCEVLLRAVPLDRGAHVHDAVLRRSLAPGPEAAALLERLHGSGDRYAERLRVLDDDEVAALGLNGGRARRR